VSRTREIRWGLRLASVTGLILFGALLLGAQPGIAAPPAPVGPTDIAPPTTVTTTTTKPPKPNFDPPTGDFEIEKPCWVTDTCKPPTDPSEPPSDDPKPDDPKPDDPTTPKQPATPADPPAAQPDGIPLPNRIDTGEGSAPESPVWMFWLVPALAVLALTAGAAGWWLARSEQQDRR
jgi:hypothetical protein